MLDANSLQLTAWTEMMVYAGWAAGIGSISLLLWQIWEWVWDNFCFC